MTTTPRSPDRRVPPSSPEGSADDVPQSRNTPPLRADNCDATQPIGESLTAVSGDSGCVDPSLSTTPNSDTLTRLSGCQAWSDDILEDLDGPNNTDDANDLYGRDVDLCSDDRSDGVQTNDSSVSSEPCPNLSSLEVPMILPSGWERFEDDDDGTYYFHARTGTLQRDMPTRDASLDMLSTSPLSSHSLCDIITETNEDILSKIDHSSTYESLSSLCRRRTNSEVSTNEGQSSQSPSSCDEIDDIIPEEATLVPVRFSVRSLGYMEINESDLTPEKSSRTVNRCIMQLSKHQREYDAEHAWANGKDLLMDLDDVNLTLLDPDGLKPLHSQTLRSIRVWGVGRDNSRDFAFVARDNAGCHLCYVFRCDVAARRVATTLRDLCKRLLSHKQEVKPYLLTQCSEPQIPLRPKDLPSSKRKSMSECTTTYESLLKNSAFPTPMEEPQKVIRCFYLGTTIVSQPTGIEMLNDAMTKVFSEVAHNKWVLVNVSIAPSTITIKQISECKTILSECRVRFLSFLGIAQHNSKLCSFTMHTAQNKFEAHVFHCEPTASVLCKTIEAACKLRYQKCLDSNRETTPESSPTVQISQSPNTKSISSTLKASMNSMLNGFKRIM